MAEANDLDIQHTGLIRSPARHSDTGFDITEKADIDFHGLERKEPDIQSNNTNELVLGLVDCMVNELI